MSADKMPGSIYYISYDFGFLSIHAHEIITNLIRLGCRVELFIPKNFHPHFKLHPACAVRAIPVIFRSNIFSIIFFTLLLPCFLAIRVLQTGKPDMIYARQNYLGLPPILLARILKIPYVAEVNGLVVASSSKATRTLQQFYKTWLESRILRLADVVIVPSKTLKKRITDRYRVSSKRIYAIPNGFNELMFYPRDTRTSLGRALKLAENDFIVGFIGSMGEWQGIEILKKAIQQAIIQDTSIKFLIVGDYTPDSNMIKIRSGHGEGASAITDFIKTKGLEENVVYHNFVTYESSADFMNCCDLLVAPYTTAYQEFGGGSPMKLYAYLGCAKAVIISNLNKLTDSEALKKNKAAYLVPPNDSQALVNAIIELKTNENIRKRLGRSGRDFVLRERRWAHSSAKIMDIYHQKFNKLC